MNSQHSTNTLLHKKIDGARFERRQLIVEPIGNAMTFGTQQMICVKLIISL